MPGWLVQLSTVAIATVLSLVFGGVVLGVIVPRVRNALFYQAIGALVEAATRKTYERDEKARERERQSARGRHIMLSRIVDKRGGQTFGQSQRVGELSETVARMMRLSEEACNTIRVGGILHDLGNIAIPDSILLKPGKLTAEEYEIIKKHPKAGAEILAEHPEQRDVAVIVHHHHERWDGTGYPDGVAGEQIPIGSRIVNACDAFDAITQPRVFRPTVRTPAEAIRELRELAGRWYDPAVITALEKIVTERWGVVVV